MELVENQYYNDIMFKYFLLLIEIEQYEYRQNILFVTQNSDDRALGVYEAISVMSSVGENIICVNFDPNFPVQHMSNLHFVSTNNPFISTEHPCDYLMFFNSLGVTNIKEICDYYNPKFIFHC